MANAINSLVYGNGTYVLTLPYGSCSTAAGTAAKTVTVDNFSLETGAIVAVKFTVTNTAASPTLNINSTGAKAIYYNGAAITAGYLKANKVYEFIYNGTQWDFVGDIDTNTTYSHPTYTARTGKPTGNQTPAFGGTATISQITSDSTGHVTGATDRTITIPSTLSNGTDTAGLIKTSSTVTSSSGYTACPVISGVPYYKDANTTYSVVSTTADGLAPKRDGSTTKFLRADGTWAVPPDNNTTYSAATTSAAGLMSAADKTKSEATNIAYGTCETAAATAAKVVTVSGNTNWKLAAGATITVLFSATNTAESPTLNVNSTGAKNIFYGSSQITTSSLGYAGTANRPMTFMYDGTQYRFIGWGYDSNTTYTNVKLGHGYVTCSTAAATTAKVGTLSSYTLATGGIVAVKFTYDVPANATLNINSKGAKSIYYRGAKITDGIIKAGDIATFIYSSYYHLISIDRELDVVHPSVTAGSVGTAQSPSHGGTFAIPKITYDAQGHITAASTVNITLPADNNTTYSAGTGISLSGTTFSNSGVRSIATGTSNGTISVNTGGSTANVAVKGLGSAAYTASTAYAPSSHDHSASNITSGTLPVARGGTGATTAQGAVDNLIAGTSIQPLAIEFPGMSSPPSGVTVNGG